MAIDVKPDLKTIQSYELDIEHSQTYINRIFWCPKITMNGLDFYHPQMVVIRGIGFLTLYSHWYSIVPHFFDG